MNRLPSPPLLLITDRSQARRSLEALAAAAFAGGCRWLSVREKDLEPGERLRLLDRLAAIGARAGARVGVHDDLAAAATGAALHLPAGAPADRARAALGPDRLIGRSAHAGDACADAAVSGLDYVTLSPIQLSRSKPGYGPALGFAGLAAAVAAASVPVIALGGIETPDDVAAAFRAGASGVAVMGAVMRADDPASTVAALLAAFPARGGA